MLPTLLAVIAVALFVAAGNWQRDRMQQKEALGQQLATTAGMPPVSLPAGEIDWRTWRFRTVDVSGRYVTDQQFLVDNRIHAGRAGYHVVTPLAVDDGRIVLVNRGFVAAGPTRDVLPVAPAPEGPVKVRGRVNPAPAKFLELGDNVPRRGVWQNLDPQRFAAASGLRVMPIVIEQIDGPSNGLVRHWPRPDAGTDRHRIYMMQWYAFAALAAGLWAWFTFRRRTE